MPVRLLTIRQNPRDKTTKCGQSWDEPRQVTFVLAVAGESNIDLLSILRRRYYRTESDPASMGQLLVKMRGVAAFSARHKSPVRTNLQPQFFPERLALLQSLEELIQNADNNGVDADAFRFGPFPEFVAGLLRRHGGAEGW